MASGDATRAAGTLAAALRLWRGPALSDFSDESWAQPEATRLEELRLAALEDRIEANPVRACRRSWWPSFASRSPSILFENDSGAS